MTQLRRIRPNISDVIPEAESNHLVTNTFLVKVQNQNGEPKYYKELVVAATTMTEALFLASQYIQNENVTGESLFATVKPIEILQ